MRPCWAQSLAADPPPSMGYAGRHCLPVPACPWPQPGSPGTIGARRGVQSPRGWLRQPLGTKLPCNGSPAWLAPKNAASRVTAKSFLPSQGKGTATAQHSTKPAGKPAQGLGLTLASNSPRLVCKSDLGRLETPSPVQLLMAASPSLRQEGAYRH